MHQFKLSKGPFIKSIYCQKSPWLHYNRQELKTPLSVEQQMVMNKGKLVGAAARELFNGGEDLSMNGLKYGQALIESTRLALKAGKQLLYEAAFETDSNEIRHEGKVIYSGKLMFIADVVVISQDKIKLVEVKSSTKLKLPDHVYELGFQRLVIENSSMLKEAGLEGKEIEYWFMYLNNTYIRQGELNLGEMFTLDNVTNRTLSVRPLLIPYLKELDETFRSNKMPDVKIGSHCFKPYPCEFMKMCWEGKESTVFNIGKIRKDKADKFFENGIQQISDIKDDTDLNESQWTEVIAAKTQTAVINKKEIKKFIESLRLEHPIFYMDFESIMPPIPLYDNTKCWQQLCVQYNVLYVDTNIERREFLSEPGKDPRREFIERLLEDTAEPGYIIVYNQVFEVTRLKELAELFPEYKDAIKNRIDRIKDLLLPFEKRHFYHPDQNGSASIKQVQKILVPDLSYSELIVQNGSMAMDLYERFEILSYGEKVVAKRALLEYCYRDTLVMVRIIDELKKIAA